MQKSCNANPNKGVSQETIVGGASLVIVSKDKGNEKEKEGSIDASYSYNGATIKQPGLRR